MAPGLPNQDIPASLRHPCLLLHLGRSVADYSKPPAEGEGHLLFLSPFLSSNAESTLSGPTLQSSAWNRLPLHPEGLSHGQCETEVEPVLESVFLPPFFQRATEEQKIIWSRVICSPAAKVHLCLIQLSGLVGAHPSPFSFCRVGSLVWELPHTVTDIPCHLCNIKIPMEGVVCSMICFLSALWMTGKELSLERRTVRKLVNPLFHLNIHNPEFSATSVNINTCLQTLKYWLQA